MRRFPSAALIEAQTLDAALSMASRHPPAAIIVHRTLDSDGRTVVAQLKKMLPAVPIIMVSAADRRAEALAAGASNFILRDEWLRIGVVVQEAITTAEKSV